MRRSGSRMHPSLVRAWDRRARRARSSARPTGAGLVAGMVAAVVFGPVGDPVGRADVSRIARATKPPARPRSMLTAMEEAKLDRRVAAAGTPGMSALRRRLAGSETSIPSTGGPWLRRVGPAAP